MNAHDVAIAAALAAVPGAGRQLLANLERDLFPREVPPAYIDGERVRCTCGGGATLAYNGVQPCEACHRVFLRVGDAYRCGYLSRGEASAA